MDAFGFIDYQKPLGKQMDMRTSSYRGHIYLTDTKLGNKANAKFGENRTYIAEPSLSERRITDYRSNYIWKYFDPYEIRNPTLDRKVEFIKPYDECQLRFLKRKMRPITSVSHEDFLWQREKTITPPTPMPVGEAVKVTSIVIDRTKPGYAKYLDPNATTSRLAYVGYTPDELMASVAAKDNITFWNWEAKSNRENRVFREKDEQMCNETTAKKCPKRRCEFQCTLKRVPHTGMTTEVRDNYVEPYKRVQDDDTTNIRNKMVYFPIIPFPKSTEYKIIGSGERTQKYV